MKITSLLNKHLIQIQLCIIAVLLSLILYFNLNISLEQIITVNIILITVTGIFSAILISSLLAGISIHSQTSQKIAESVFDHSKKLTYFRKVLHYLIISENIWGEEFYRDFLMKLRNSFPSIDRYTKYYELKEGDERANIANDLKFEDNRARLFLGMLTITNVSKGEELTLLESFNEDYEFEYLLNAHEAINDIWYYIEHKRAKINIKLDSVNILYRKDFEKYLLKLTNKQSLDNFNKYVLSELATEFYSEHHLKHIVLSRYLNEGLSLLYKIIFLELILLLIFGLIIPVINLTLNNTLILMLTNLSVVFVLLIFSFMIYHLARMIFNKQNYTFHKYT